MFYPQSALSTRTTRCALECGCTCTVLLDVAVLWPLRTLDLRLTARGRAKYPLFSHEVTPHRVRSCSTAGDKMTRKVRQPCQRSSASAIALFVDQRQKHLVLLSQTSENGNSRSTAPVWHERCSLSVSLHRYGNPARNRRLPHQTDGSPDRVGSPRLPNAVPLNTLRYCPETMAHSRLMTTYPCISRDGLCID